LISITRWREFVIRDNLPPKENYSLFTLHYSLTLPMARICNPWRVLSPNPWRVLSPNPWRVLSPNPLLASPMEFNYYYFYGTFILRNTDQVFAWDSL